MIDTLKSARGADWTAVAQALSAVALLVFTFVQAAEGARLRRGQAAALVTAMRTAVIKASAAIDGGKQLAAVGAAPQHVIAQAHQLSSFLRTIQATVHGVDLSKLPTAMAMTRLIEARAAIDDGVFQLDLLQRTIVDPSVFDSLDAALGRAAKDFAWQLSRLQHPTRTRVLDSWFKLTGRGRAPPDA